MTSCIGVKCIDLLQIEQPYNVLIEYCIYIYQEGYRSLDTLCPYDLVCRFRPDSRSGQSTTSCRCECLRHSKPVSHAREISMPILWQYLRPHGWLGILALLLAATSQILALVDPIIFGIIIDEYAVAD